VTMALGLHGGHVNPGDRIALLGIGSGINCVMLAVHWETTLVASQGPCPAWASLDELSPAPAISVASV